MPLSRGGASTASEHGVAACHLCGQLETETHGLPFTDWLAMDWRKMESKAATRLGINDMTHSHQIFL